MPSNLNTLSSLKTLLTNVYHTNDKYIFKLHFKNLLNRYFCKLQTKHTFQDHFMNKQIYPKTCTIVIYMCHNSGCNYYFLFFLFYKWNCSDFKLKDLFKESNSFYCICCMGSVHHESPKITPRGSIHHDYHLN